MAQDELQSIWSSLSFCPKGNHSGLSHEKYRLPRIQSLEESGFSCYSLSNLITNRNLSLADSSQGRLSQVPPIHNFSCAKYPLGHEVGGFTFPELSTRQCSPPVCICSRNKVGESLPSLWKPLSNLPGLIPLMRQAELMERQFVPLQSCFCPEPVWLLIGVVVMYTLNAFSPTAPWSSWETKIPLFPFFTFSSSPKTFAAACCPDIIPQALPLKLLPLFCGPCSTVPNFHVISPQTLISFDQAETMVGKQDTMKSCIHHWNIQWKSSHLKHGQTSQLAPSQDMISSHEHIHTFPGKFMYTANPIFFKEKFKSIASTHSVHLCSEAGAGGILSSGIEGIYCTCVTKVSLVLAADSFICLCELVCCY